MTNNINSNTLKDIPMPDDFNDDDKLRFEVLYNESKVKHSDVYKKEPWIIYYAIIMNIRSEKGHLTLTDNELEELASKYKQVPNEVICNGKEIPYLYDSSNNPIFKDNSYFFENDKNGNNAFTSNVIDKVIIELEDKIIYNDNIE